jgi:fibronectin type 3 domain-containing protein
LATGLAFVDVDPVNGQLNNYSVAPRKFLNSSSSMYVEGPAAQVAVTPLVLPSEPGFFGITVTAYAPVQGQYYLTVTASLSSMAAQSSVTLQWNRALPGSSIISWYQVYRGQGSQAQALGLPMPVSSTISPLSLSDTGLSAGSSYTYSVTAMDQIGNTGPALVRSFSLIPPGAASFSVAYPLSPTAGHASLSWAAPSFLPNPFNHYLLYRSLSPNQLGSLIANTTGTAWVDSQANSAYAYQYYQVAVVDDIGLTGPASLPIGVSLSASGLAHAAPAQVSAVAAQALIGSVVQLAWAPNSSVDQVTQYHVYSNGLWIGSTNQDSFSDTTVSYGNSYTYAVQAQNSVAAGLSGTVSLTPLPPAPGGLSMVTDGQGNPGPSLSLSWNAMSIPSQVSSYTLYRSIAPFSSTATALVIPGLTSNSYTDTSVLSGTSYEYRIADYLAFSGVSSTVSTLGQTMAAQPPPAAPSGLQDSPTNLGGAVSLSWTTCAGCALQFIVYRDINPLGSNPPIGTKIVTVAASPNGNNHYVDSAAQAGTTYYYAVASLNYYGASSSASQFSPVLPQGGQPSTLSALAAAGSSTWTAQVTLTWSPPASSYAQTLYTLWRDTTAKFLSPLRLTDTAALTFTDASLLTATAYYYEAVSGNAAPGVSQALASGTAYGQAAAPQQFLATPNSSGLSLSWLPANPLDGVNGYQIFYLPQSITANVGGTASSYNITGLNPALPVSVWLTPFNSWGAGPQAAASSHGSLALGSAVPLSLSAKTGFSEASPSLSHVLLSWNSQSGQSALSYQIYRSSSPLALTQAAGGSLSPVWMSSVPGNFNTATDSNVSAGATYYYALSSVSPTGLPAGESSPVFSPAVIPFNYPSAVSFTSARAGDNRADLAWSVPSDFGSAGSLASQPYTLYRYSHSTLAPAPAFRAQSSDPGFPISMTSTGYVDLNASNGLSYTYYVTATDSLGREQDQPAVVDLTPGASAKPPLLLQFIPGNNVVLIRWFAESADHSLYNVYRRDISSASNADYMGVLPGLREVGPSSYNNGTQVVETLADTTALNTHTYCYSIASLSTSNGGEEGPKSDETCVTPFLPLNPSANGQVTASLTGLSHKDVSLAWTACPANGSYPLAGYKIYRSQDGGSSFSPITFVSATLYTDTSTQFGLSYIYRVVPVDSGTPANEGISYRVVEISIPAQVNNVLIFRNSFNPAKGESVPIQYMMLKSGHVWVKVFTLEGVYVNTIFDETLPGNVNANSPYLSAQKTWNGTNALGQIVASGVYLIHMEGPDFSANGRVAVIK